MRDSRNNIVDIMRGVAIVDMMVIHYGDALQAKASLGVFGLILYADFAMEAFVGLTGFMVGWHYLERFRQSRRAIIRRLLARVVQIAILYYIMILTISVPLVILVGSKVTNGDSGVTYIVKSLLFLNQVGLLHILPTFIPLLLVSIPVMYALDSGCGYIVITASVGLFILGNIDPYVFSLGEKTVFPVILWQIYFIGGIMLGRLFSLGGGRLPASAGLHLGVAVGALSVMLMIKYSHHIVPEIGGWLIAHGVVVKKFPLNYLGLLYYGSMFYVVSCSVVFILRYRAVPDPIVNSVALMGRNSLFVFMVHVYFSVAVSYSGVPIAVTLIVLNVGLVLWMLNIKENGWAPAGSSWTRRA